MSINWIDKSQYTKMNKIAVISDPHINLKEGAEGNECKILQKCFKNMSVDTLVVCGDITENAQPDELHCFFDTYKVNCQAKNLFLIPGNMDETEYPEGKKTFLDIYGKSCGVVFENTYFTHEADNCILIGITPEQDDDDVPLSENQLYVLDEYIRKAAERNVPALVFCHYVINDTINVDWKYAKLGEQSLQVRTIFEKYRGKVICFSGHIHRGLIKEPGGSILTLKNVTYVSTPSVCIPDKIHYKADNDNVGTGYILDLCPDYVRISGFDFLNNQWLEAFDWRV